MIPLDSFVGQSADGKMVPIIPGGNSIPPRFLIGKNMWRGPLNIDFMSWTDRWEETFERFTWEVWEVCFWLQIGAVWFLLNFGVWVQWCWLICIYISVPIQETFQAISQVCSLLRALGEPWIGQCLAGRPNPIMPFRTPLFSLALSSSVFFVFTSYCPRPSVLLQLSQGPCEWVPEDWPCDPMRAFFPPGLCRPFLSPRNPSSYPYFWVVG